MHWAVARAWERPRVLARPGGCQTLTAAGHWCLLRLPLYLPLFSVSSHHLRGRRAPRRLYRPPPLHRLPAAGAGLCPRLAPTRWAVRRRAAAPRRWRGGGRRRQRRGASAIADGSRRRVRRPPGRSGGRRRGGGGRCCGRGRGGGAPSPPGWRAGATVAGRAVAVVVTEAVVTVAVVIAEAVAVAMAEYQYGTHVALIIGRGGGECPQRRPQSA